MGTLRPASPPGSTATCLFAEGACLETICQQEQGLSSYNYAVCARRRSLHANYMRICESLLPRTFVIGNLFFFNWISKFIRFQLFTLQEPLTFRVSWDWCKQLQAISLLIPFYTRRGFSRRWCSAVVEHKRTQNSGNFSRCGVLSRGDWPDISCPWVIDESCISFVRFSEAVRRQHFHAPHLQVGHPAAEDLSDVLVETISSHLERPTWSQRCQSRSSRFSSIATSVTFSYVFAKWPQRWIPWLEINYLRLIGWSFCDLGRVDLDRVAFFVTCFSKQQIKDWRETDAQQFKKSWNKNEMHSCCCSCRIPCSGNPQLEQWPIRLSHSPHRHIWLTYSSIDLMFCADSGCSTNSRMQQMFSIFVSTPHSSPEFRWSSVCWMPSESEGYVPRGLFRCQLLAFALDFNSHRDKRPEPYMMHSWLGSKPWIQLIPLKPPVAWAQQWNAVFSLFLMWR